MEKFECEKSAEVLQPFFEEHELDVVGDEAFKIYIEHVGQTAVREADGNFDLNCSIDALTPYLVPERRITEIEKRQRVISRLTPLKRYSYFHTEAKGDKNHKHIVCDKDNLLVAFSYLYVHKKGNENKYEGRRPTVEGCLIAASVLWQEHPMGGKIKGLTELKMKDRIANFENISFEQGIQLRRGVEIKIPQKPHITDELISSLAQVNKEWIENYRDLIRQEIIKKPSDAFCKTVEWGINGPSKEIGEAIEFIRRVKSGREIIKPLSDVYIGEWNDALEIVMSYFDTLRDKNPSLERLVRYSLKKHEEPKARR